MPAANHRGVRSGWRSVTGPVWRSPTPITPTPHVEETGADSHGRWVRPAAPTTVQAAPSKHEGDDAVRASGGVVRATTNGRAAAGGWAGGWVGWRAMVVLSGKFGCRRLSQVAKHWQACVWIRFG
jgi:hypothetical protein